MASVSARIRCEIEVEVGVWNGSSTFDQLREQVQREGLSIVQGIFVDRDIKETPRGCVIPGRVKVLFVTVADDEKVGAV